MTSQQLSRLKILVAFVSVYFVWGTTYLAIKYAIETIPPFLMMGMRSLLAGIVLYTWGRLRGDTNVAVKELPSLLLIGSLFFLIGHGVEGIKCNFISFISLLPFLSKVVTSSGYPTLIF